MARIAAVPEPSAETDRLPTPYQAPYVTPEGEGAGFGRVMEQAGTVLAGYAKDAKERADTTAEVAAFANGQHVINSAVTDDRTGYVSLRGKDAIDARDKTLETVNKQLDAVNSGLSPDQQRRFAPRLQQLKEETQRTVINHESREIQAYSTAQYKGAVDETVKSMQAPDVVTDPDSLQAKVSNLYQVGIDEAKRRYGQNASKDAISAVVTPELQNASLAAMQAAVAQADAAGDPTIAKKAFDVLGKYMVTNHQQQFAKFVGALTAKDEISKNSRGIVASSVDSVPVPGADPVARVDDTRFAKILATIAPDSKYAAEIEAAANKQRETLGKVWNAAAGTVYHRVESDAMQGGGFDLSRAKTADVEWLRINDPDAHLKLIHEDQKGDKAATSQASAEAYSSLAADMAAHPDVYKEMSAPQFTKLSVDQGVGARDRVKALNLFEATQKAGLSEKINATVRDQILSALPNTGDAPDRDALHGPVLDAATKWVDNYKAGAEGKLPKTDEIRQFIDSELATVKVVGSSGRFWPDGTVRRIEYERNAAYRGLTAVPVDPSVQTAPAIPQVQAATPVAPPARQPPVPGAKHITDGKRGAWLPPGNALPAGWKED